MLFKLPGNLVSASKLLFERALVDVDSDLLRTRNSLSESIKKNDVRHRIDRPTGYASLLLAISEKVIQSLIDQRADCLEGIEAVYLTGAVADGSAREFHLESNYPMLGEASRVLFAQIYQWLLLGTAKGLPYANLRFFDSDLSDELKLLLIGVENLGQQESNRRYESFAETFKRSFSQHSRLVPRISVQHMARREFSAEEANEAIRLYPHDTLAEIAGDVELGGEQPAAALPPTLKMQLLNPVGSREPSGPMEDVLVIENPVESKPNSSHWHAANWAIFSRIRTGEYRHLVLEDFSRALDDVKGFDKENAYTVSRVLRMETDDGTIESVDLLLKGRGLPNFRSDINNKVDLLKEYFSYHHIYQALDSYQDFFSQIGPLSMNAEKFGYPFEQEELVGVLGFFLQEHRLPEGFGALTVRVNNLTDPAALLTNHARLLAAGNLSGIAFDRGVLLDELKHLTTLLWASGLSIDYCDLMIQYDRHDSGSLSLKVFDLERVNFSELVNEEHDLIAVLVDIKSHLAPEKFLSVLPRVYLSRNDPNGFASFDEVKADFKPDRKRRAFKLRLLHLIARILAPLGATISSRAMEILFSLYWKIKRTVGNAKPGQVEG